MNKAELLSSDHFCIMPFVHACVWPSGDAVPCCLSRDYIIGNTNTESLSDIYSSKNEKLNLLKQEMINGPTLPKACSDCVFAESLHGGGSYRKSNNQTYGYLIYDLDLYNDTRISLWDIRFNNLCNLKCRICDGTSSTSIAAENKIFFKSEKPVLSTAISNISEFTSFFLNYIDYLEEIYFCGGEPLIMPEHYALLDLLIEHKKFDTALRYNSNCTKIEFKRKNVLFDYWAKFKNIQLYASIDGSYDRLSVMRHGSKWNEIKENLQAIRLHCPHIIIEWAPTVYVLNTFHIKEVYNELKDLIDEVYFNILTSPKQLSSTILPLELKNNATEYLDNWILEIDDYQLSNEIIKFKEYINSVDHSYLIPRFKYDMSIKDQNRNESTVTVFPELKLIL